MNIKSRRTYALSRDEIIQIVADHLCISRDDTTIEVIMKSEALAHPQPVFWISAGRAMVRPSYPRKGWPA